MNDLPESMQEDPLGACRGATVGCLIVCLIGIIVLILLFPGLLV